MKKTKFLPLSLHFRRENRQQITRSDDDKCNVDDKMGSHDGEVGFI